MEDGGAVDIIYTDFAKAVDSVPNKRLISNVNALGITFINILFSVGHYKSEK